MPSRSKHVQSRSITLNAQWLSNAAKTLGMNGISTIADISPNMAGAGSVAASSIKTATTMARTITRQQRPIQYLLESNKYVKIGKRAINNALADLAQGKFSNTERDSSGENQFGDTKTGTYFGDMSDGSGEENSGQTIQNVYNTVDNKAISAVSDAVNTQTKYQLQMGKANIDTMVAVAASSMTQSQKNADALLTQVSEMNRGIQSLVAYNNESMSKFISASMTYYESAGKALGGNKKTDEVSPLDILNSKGGLNLTAYGDRVKKQFKEALAGSTYGALIQMVAENAEEFANNPMELISKAVMDKAIPEVTKKALKSADKVFGSFMTEMLLQVTDKFESDTSETMMGSVKRFIAKTLGIRDKRTTSINRQGKISEEAAVFDGIARTALVDELPKYARESTAYLRSLVELMGGDPNGALRGSRILNRESGRYQSMESFAKEFSDSFDKSVISAMDSGSFGESMRAMAAMMGKNEEQQKRLNDAIDRFYVAAERSTKTNVNLADMSDGSALADIIKDAGLDANMEKFIKRSIAGVVRNQTGMESFNESRARATKSRNQRAKDVEAENGLMRTTNLFRSGGSDKEIDISTITAERLLPQRRSSKESSGSINLPGAKPKSVAEEVSEALYGRGTAKVVGVSDPNRMGIGSVGERLKTVTDILLRGINVKIVPGEPWVGTQGLGSSTATLGGGSTATTSSGIIITGTGQSNKPADEAQPTATSLSNEPDLSDIDKIADETLGQAPPPTSGKGAKSAEMIGHAKQAMYLMMSGNATLAMNEMSAAFGSVLSGVGSMAKKNILDPIKNMILPTKEFVDENGNKTTKQISILDMVKEKFTGITNSVKETILGKDGNGNVKSVSGWINEGFAEWRKAFFGDKDPEELKKEIQDRVPGAVGGAVTGGLLGTLVGGPVVGAIMGGAVGFAQKSEWFQEMMFGKTDADGKKIKEGLIPPSVKEYYEKNKSALTGGAAIGGLIGLAAGGPLLGAVAGVGATVLSRSEKVNELLFGKEETDDKGNKKKVGGILNLFKDVMGHYGVGTKDDTKGLSAKAALGVGGGLLLSLFTPIGPIGGAALGLAATLATNGDKFKTWLFGKENPDGTKEAGLFQKLGNTIHADVINPLRDGVLDFFEKSKDKVIDNMLAPMLTALQPLLNLGGRIYENTLGKVAKLAEGAAGAFGNLLKKVGKALWDKTIGKVGRMAKKVLGAGMSVVTGVAGGAFRGAGWVAEKLNRGASRKRFEKEGMQNQDLIDKWTQEYKSNPALQYRPIEEFLDNKKSTYYYNYGDKLKNFFGTKEEREQKRAETAKRSEERKDITMKTKLINQLTGGKFADTSDAAKQAALDAYMSSAAYAKGKGMNIKHYGKMSQEDIMKALKIEPKNAKEAEEAKALSEAELEAARKSAGHLADIANWLGKVGEKITGVAYKSSEAVGDAAHKVGDVISSADDALNVKLTGKTRGERRQERKQKAQDYDTALAESNQKQVDSNARDVREDIKTEQIKKWKHATKEIQKGLKSKNDTVREAAEKAYPVFFNKDGTEKWQGTAKNEKRKEKAWAEYQATLKTREANRVKVGAFASLRRYLNLSKLNTEANDLPHKADGGNVDEGYAVVGERGPEIVNFRDEARVLSGQQKIDVNVVGMEKEVLSKFDEMTAVQDVRIVGQQGLLATYGTSAKLGSKTNNANKIKKAIEDPEKTVTYGDIEPDNDDYEGKEDNKSPLTKLFESLKTSTGGILETIGGFAEPLMKIAGGIATLVGVSDLKSFWEKVVKGDKGLNEWFAEDSNIGKAVRSIPDFIDKFLKFGAALGPLAIGMTNTTSKAITATSGALSKLSFGLLPKISPPTISDTGPLGGLQAAILGGLYLKGVQAIGSTVDAAANVYSALFGNNGIAQNITNMLPKGAGTVAKYALGALAVGNLGYSLIKGPETHENTSAGGEEIVDNAKTNAMRAPGVRFLRDGIVGRWSAARTEALAKRASKAAAKNGDDVMKAATEVYEKRAAAAGTKQTMSKKFTKELGGLQKESDKVAKELAEKKAAEKAISEASENSTKKLSRSQKKAQKRAQQRAKGKPSAQKAAQNAANKADDVAKAGANTAESMAAKGLDKLDDVAEAAAKNADEAGGVISKAKGFIKKALEGMKSFLCKNDKIKKAAGAVEAVTKKLDDVITTIADFPAKMAQKLVTKLASIMGKNISEETAKAITAGIGYGVMGLVGAASGAAAAAQIFNVRESDVDGTMRTIAAIIVGMLNSVPGIWAIEMADLFISPFTMRGIICELLYRFLGNGEELDAKRAAMDESRNAYNAKYGTELSSAEYNDMVNKGLGDKMWAGGAKLDANGNYMFDDAGNVLRTGGVKGLFVGGEKEYAKDANGNVIKDANGKAVVARDQYGNVKKKDEKWGDKVAQAANSAWRWVVGGKTYKTDENGNAIYDTETGKFVEDPEKRQKNILARKWDSFWNGEDGKKGANDTIKDAAAMGSTMAERAASWFNKVTENLSKTADGSEKSLAQSVLDHSLVMRTITGTAAKTLQAGAKILKDVSEKGLKEVAKDALKGAKDVAKKGISKVVDFFTGGKPFDSTVTGTAIANTPGDYSGGGYGGNNIIPFYSQKDPRWANTPYDMKNTETMYDAGCGPAVLSMAASGAGAGVDPVGAASTLKAVGARDNTGTSWGGMSKGLSSYGLNSDESRNPGTNFIDSGISSGKPVILSGSSLDSDDPYTSAGHYVVVSGRDRSGNYVVNDPNKSMPVTYSKEQVTRNASKGWRVGGGRGRFRVIKGGRGDWQITNKEYRENKTTSFNNPTPPKDEKTVGSELNRWISTVRATKQAIAALKPGYQDDSWLGFNITINVGGRAIKARSDCTGLISAALTLFGAWPEGTAYNAATYAATGGECASRLRQAGFTNIAWPGWEGLQEGDILAKNGHAEIFCRLDGSKRLVYNCGATDCVNNPGPTPASYPQYTTVWRLVSATGVNGVNEFDVSQDYASSTSGSYNSGDAGYTPAPKKKMSFLEKLSKWATTLGGKALGYLTGEKTLAEAKDWSGWLNEDDGGGTYNSGDAGYNGEYAATNGIGNTVTGKDFSNGAVAQLQGSDDTEQIWNHLRKNSGFDKNAAAAAMGCWEAESHNNPDTFEGNYTQEAKDFGGANAVLASNDSLNRYTTSVLFPYYANKGRDIDQGAYKGADGNWYPGFGLAQWTGIRGQKLFDFAKQKNSPWRALSTQLGYFDWELANRVRGDKSTYNDKPTLEAATRNFMEVYEGVNTDEHFANRIPSARRYYELYADKEETSAMQGDPRYTQTELDKLTAMQRNWARNKSRDLVPFLSATTAHNGVGGGFGDGPSTQIAGSSSPIDFGSRKEISGQSTETGGVTEKIVSLLEEISTLLGSSDKKLNNLQYLSDLRNMGGNVTNNNNVAMIQQPGMIQTPSPNRRTSGGPGTVDKQSSDAYNDARLITAG